MVDARHSKCRDFGHVGSSPTIRTTFSVKLHSEAPAREAGTGLALLAKGQPHE